MAGARRLGKKQANPSYTVTTAIMALTSAEKQRRYRERHLGIHGKKERIQLAFRQAQSSGVSPPATTVTQ
jgi:hypothetical protein